MSLITEVKCDTCGQRVSVDLGSGRLAGTTRVLYSQPIGWYYLMGPDAPAAAACCAACVIHLAEVYEPGSPAAYVKRLEAPAKKGKAKP